MLDKDCHTFDIHILFLQDLYDVSLKKINYLLSLLTLIMLIEEDFMYFVKQKDSYERQRQRFYQIPYVVTIQFKA